MTSYIVTFGQLVKHMNTADTHRQYGSLSSTMIACLRRQE